MPPRLRRGDSDVSRLFFPVSTFVTIFLSLSFVLLPWEVQRVCTRHARVGIRHARVGIIYVHVPVELQQLLSDDCVPS